MLPSHSEKITEAFRKAGVATDLIAFPEAGHGFTGPDEKTASAALTAWFEKYLTVDPPAKPDAPPAAANPAGTWETIASLPDGGTRPGTIVIKEENGQLTAAASGEQGDRKMDLIKWEKGNLMLERGIERDGRQGKIKVSARESAAGQLTGTWSLTDDGGNELMTGAWEAKKKSTP